MEPKPRVLIVEREEACSVPFEEKLRSADLATVERCLPEQAAKAVQRAVPDLLVIDVHCPGPTCEEICHTIRRLVDPAFMPVIMLTEDGDDSVRRGFEAGADECIRRSCGVDEVVARVRSLLRMKAQHEELCRRNRELTELSTRDELTGLYNRRYLFEHMAAEVERAVRYQDPLSCIMIDVDGFKSINDTHGHLVGDALFRRAAEVFQSVPRRIDTVARYGGDEVMILLPATGLEAAVILAERVRETIAQEAFFVGDRRIPLTASMGVASFDPGHPVTVDELVRRADVALYVSKKAGGNRVTTWTRDVETGIGNDEREPRTPEE